MKRAPLQRTPFKSARSSLRRAVDREMRAAKVQLLERDRHCILCDQPGDDPHHRLPQGSGGALRDPSVAALSRLVLLCRRHHDWVESHRSFAEFLGLIVRHGITPPADVPLFHHGRWVLLDDHGCVIPTPGLWANGLVRLLGGPRTRLDSSLSGEFYA